MLKIKREDEVIIIAGRDKGKRGKVSKVMKNGRLLVSGLNKVKKHQKPNPNLNQVGGIIDIEAPIDASNVAIYNTETEKADRVGFRFEDGKKVRFFKSTGQLVGA